MDGSLSKPSVDGSVSYALLLGRVTGWAACLSKAIGWVQESGRGIGWAQQYNGLSSELIQGYCSGSLVMWGERLCLTVK